MKLDYTCEFAAEQLSVLPLFLLICLPLIYLAMSVRDSGPRESRATRTLGLLRHGCDCQTWKHSYTCSNIIFKKLFENTHVCNKCHACDVTRCVRQQGAEQCHCPTFMSSNKSVIKGRNQVLPHVTVCSTTPGARTTTLSRPLQQAERVSLSRQGRGSSLGQEPPLHIATGTHCLASC